MEKVRVGSLARELGMPVEDVLGALNDMDEYVRGPASTVEAPVAAELRRRFAASQQQSAALRGPQGRDLSLREALKPAPGRESAATSRQYGWRAGAIPLPQHRDLLANIERLAVRFPVFRNHLQALRSLGSQVVFAGMCRQPGFTNCGIALVRFSGAIENGFGFTREVMLFYSPHADLQGRTFEIALNELASQNRSATPDTFFMWAPDARLRIKLNDWSRPSRLAIPLLIDEADEFSLIGLLRDYVYARDLFYTTTPVYGAAFFGRRTLLQSLRDDVFNQRVTGLFGLRKSGKTSILMQLKQELADDSIVTILMDLETFPSPPDDPTDDILAEMRRRLITELKARNLRTQELSQLSERPTILELKNALQVLLKRFAKDGIRVLLLLDEIEYLTPSDKVDIAEGDMPRIAQMLAGFRSLVQETETFTFVLSGLTSAIIEGGRLYGRPNPLFSWAKAVYVSPLTREEADDLATTVGAKMGVQIQDGALEALHEASGGHAFLYRSLSSAVASRLSTDDYQRVMSRGSVLNELEEWKSRVQGNIDEMIQHVRRYYPNEAVMLEILMDNPADFEELAPVEHVAVRRLKDLGLIRSADGSYETSVILELT